jgi:hypothetical protein
MISPVMKARILGAMLLIAAAGAGFGGGYAYRARQPAAGVMISVTGTDRIPKELEDLELTDAQRAAVRQALRNGTERVGRVLHLFTGPMDAAIDSTDREVRASLTESQNRRLDEIRKRRPLRQMKTLVDTARR